jgi:hypothetical protein
LIRSFGRSTTNRIVASGAALLGIPASGTGGSDFAAREAYTLADQHCERHRWSGSRPSAPLRPSDAGLTRRPCDNGRSKSVAVSHRVGA